MASWKYTLERVVKELDLSNEKKQALGDLFDSDRIPKDGSLEALDFIVKVLIEHEKDLDRLIRKLGRMVHARMNETRELPRKIEKVEEHLSMVESGISHLTEILSTHKLEVPLHKPPVLLRCEKWEDFRGLATGAEIVSFLLKDKSFQIHGGKKGRIVTYSGDLPQDATILKIWLSKELNVPEEKISFDNSMIR